MKTKPGHSEEVRAYEVQSQGLQNMQNETASARMNYHQVRIIFTSHPHPSTCNDS